MSFPRAKMQRFNDGNNSTPAPGSYDPKFGSKVKGAIIEKSGRFTDKTDGESPAAAVSKASSMNCLPVFRTPQLPRKTTKVPSKTSCKKILTRRMVLIKKNCKERIFFQVQIL
ncbi:hyaluronan mediated motility receptor-like isoform X2 [Anabrus simplex]|uniref:hyaluronan mediated motility receptor-like isoform X2 n=1 Tax=Anabrus simplex TaxID=316456 RepID=UPI0035A38D9A